MEQNGHATRSNPPRARTRLMPTACADMRAHGPRAAVPGGSAQTLTGMKPVGSRLINKLQLLLTFPRATQAALGVGARSRGSHDAPARALTA